MADQVERLEVFKRDHPTWEIRPPLDPQEVMPWWRATSPDGTVDVSGLSLEALLSQLEALDDV